MAEALGHKPHALRKGMRSDPALVQSVLEKAQAWRSQTQGPAREPDT